MSNHSPHTMPCPECNSPIPVSLEILLSGKPLICFNPQCGVELSIDFQKSEKAINAMNKMQGAITQLNQTKEKLK